MRKPAVVFMKYYHCECPRAIFHSIIFQTLRYTYIIIHYYDDPLFLPTEFNIFGKLIIPKEQKEGHSAKTKLKQILMGPYVNTKWPSLINIIRTLFITLYIVQTVFSTLAIQYTKSSMKITGFHCTFQVLCKKKKKKLLYKFICILHSRQNYFL